MISALYFGSMSLDQSPSRSYCVVFLGNTIHSHIATLTLLLSLSMRALTLQWTSIQSREEKKYFYSVNATEIGDKRLPDASLRPNADFTFE